MTQRLYYRDSHARAFDAEVLSCVQEKERWAVTLSDTAFFPEGGGQPGDTGALGAVRVLDTREREGSVVHLCDGPLTVGETVHGVLDWEQRFARMQGHSGEHIVSGIAHSLWGCENVGFHVGESAVTLDFDRELNAEQLLDLEQRANRAVWENVPVRAGIPAPEELAALEYRQKKPLSGDIRIVEVEGVDRCACCAPHVKSTGEIGLIHFVMWERHRGGVRITMAAGQNALTLLGAYRDTAERLSRLLSAPRDGLAEAGERLARELERTKFALVGAERAYTALRAESLRDTEENICLFEPAERSAAALRELCEAGAARTNGICSVFAGSEEAGWRYVMGSRSVDLRANAKAVNAAINGRGGGSREMIQGSAAAGREELERFVRDFRGR